MSALPQRVGLPVMSPTPAGLRGLSPVRDDSPAIALDVPVSLLQVTPTASDPAASLAVRRATPADVDAIHALQADFVASRILLARTTDQIRAAIERYVVAVDGERIIGTGMLKLYSAELAEVCALAVAPAYQKHGIGRRVVTALLEDAAAMGVRRVIALTLEDGFFHRLGFTTTLLSLLPQKVAADCQVCPKRHACDEIAVVREVAPALSDSGRI